MNKFEFSKALEGCILLRNKVCWVSYLLLLFAIGNQCIFIRSQDFGQSIKLHVHVFLCTLTMCFMSYYMNFKAVFVDSLCNIWQ